MACRSSSESLQPRWCSRQASPFGRHMRLRLGRVLLDTGEQRAARWRVHRSSAMASCHGPAWRRVSNPMWRLLLLQGAVRRRRWVRTTALRWNRALRRPPQLQRRPARRGAPTCHHSRTGTATSNILVLANGARGEREGRERRDRTRTQTQTTIEGRRPVDTSRSARARASRATRWRRGRHSHLGHLVVQLAARVVAGNAQVVEEGHAHEHHGRMCLGDVPSSERSCPTQLAMQRREFRSVFAPVERLRTYLAQSRHHQRRQPSELTECSVQLIIGGPYPKAKVPPPYHRTHTDRQRRSSYLPTD